VYVSRYDTCQCPARRGAMPAGARCAMVSVHCQRATVAARRELIDGREVLRYPTLFERESPRGLGCRTDWPKDGLGTLEVVVRQLPDADPNNGQNNDDEHVIGW